jgi:tetratricopeptide (TPR) repeat protein
MENNKIRKLTEFLKIDPRDCFTWFALASELSREGRTDDAVKAYRKLLSINPDYVGAYYHFGKLMETLNQPDEAIRLYLSGIDCARKTGDTHAASELQEAYNILEMSL